MKAQRKTLELLRHHLTEKVKVKVKLQVPGKIMNFCLLKKVGL